MRTDPGQDAGPYDRHWRVYVNSQHPDQVMVSLPSEKQAFRVAMRKLGATPFTSRSSSYWLPKESWREFQDLVEKHYPNWFFYKTTWDAPWVQEEVAQQMVEEALGEEYHSTEALFHRVAARIRQRGAQAEAVGGYEDGSIHLHVTYNGRHVCLIFETPYRFDHARIGNHHGVHVGFVEAVDYLGLPDRERP